MDNHALYCRLCAEKKLLPQLLQITNKHLLEDVDEMLSFFQRKIDFSAENFPQTLCKTCYRCLGACYDFFKNVDASQCYFEEIFREPWLEDTKGCNSKNLKKIEKTHPCTKGTEYSYSAPKMLKDDMGEKYKLTFLMNIIESSFEDSDTQVGNKNELCDKHEVTENNTLIDEFGVTSSNASRNNQVNESEVSYNNKVTNDNVVCHKNVSVKKKGCDQNEDINIKNGIGNMNKSTVNNEAIDNTNRSNNNETNADASWNSYPWICKHCSEQFHTMEMLREHSKDTHARCDFYQCHDCAFSDDSFIQFTEHVYSHRPGLRYYCPYCNIKMEDSMHLNTHTGKLNCDLCGEMFETKALLEAHLEIYKMPMTTEDVSDTEPMDWFFEDNKLSDDSVTSENVKESSWDDLVNICAYCGIEVLGLIEFKRHVKFAHDKCFGVKCKDCADVQPFYLFDEYIEHVRNHKSDLRVFDNEVDTLFHTLQHKVEQHPPIRCLICGETQLSKKSLQTHRKNYNVNEVKKNIPMVKIEPKTYLCDQCATFFNSATSLTRHALIHNSEEPLVCKICSRSFLTLPRLKEHLARHLNHKYFECNECHKKMTRKSNLISHMTRHYPIKPSAMLDCSLCEKKFTTKSFLRSHMKMHTGERPYSCKFCDKDFSCWTNCNKHMLRIHKTPLSKPKYYMETINKDEKFQDWTKEILMKGKSTRKMMAGSARKRRRKPRQANVQ